MLLYYIILYYIVLYYTIFYSIIILYLSTSYTNFLQQTHIFKGGWLKRGVGPKGREVVIYLVLLDIRH